jgi:hypothetical protein
MLICSANAHSLRCNCVLSSAMRLCTLFWDVTVYSFLRCDCVLSSVTSQNSGDVFYLFVTVLLLRLRYGL